MSIGEMGGQTSHRQKRLQGGWRALRRCALLAVPALLAGCSFSPANWFHAREGGAISQPHAAAPGANQPYPNLASVPENPTPPDMAALEHISNGLIADRANAQHLAAAAPLTDPSLPTASPGLFGVGTASPPAPGAGQALPSGSSSAASASLAAATAPPAPATPAAPPAGPARQAVAEAAPTPPQKAPVGAVASAPLPAATATAPLPALPAEPPPSPAMTGIGAPPGHVQAGAGGGAVSAGTSPAAPPSEAMAAASAPSIGVPPVPRASTRPSAAPPQAPAPAPQPPPNPANAVEIEFAPGASSLPPAQLPALRALAGKRGNRVVEALGRGDSASTDPSAQQQAVTLGFARAQAIAAALAADGVPKGAIQVMSVAAGRGGMAQLLE